MGRDDRHNVVAVWGETTASDGAASGEAIFYPGAGRDPLGEEQIARHGHLLVVAGGQAGRAAARAFIAELIPAYYAGGEGAEALRQAVDEARAGTTGLDYVAVAISGEHLFLARAGGGRAYRVRGATVDPLTRATAPAGEHPAFSLAVPLRPGDRVALCSEAPAAAIGDGRSLAFLGEQRSPREAAARLVALARERGVAGDVSVVIAFISPAPRLERGQTATLLALGAAAVAAVGWLLWELVRYWQAAG